MDKDALEGFPAWPRSRPARWLRASLLRCFFLPLLRLGYRIDVAGVENIDALSGPCIVISNHNMHIDWCVLLAALPGRFRRRLTVAASARDIFGNPFRRVSSQLVGNAFPLESEGSGVREGLEFITGLAQDGWNTLLFPEGKLTVMGPTQPFKPGVGWLAVRMGSEVLPVRIDVLRPGVFEGRWLPPRGRVQVTIGKPARAQGASYAEIAVKLEAAIRDA